MSDKILDKLAKLLAHAESATEIGNTHEAAAFAERIQHLCNQHDLSLDDVERHRRAGDAISLEIVGVGLDLWQRMLLSTIAFTNGCFAVSNAAGIHAISGTEQNRAVTRALFKYFADLGGEFQARHERAQEVNTIRLGSVIILPGAYSMNGAESTESYMLGFATKICERLQNTYEQDYGTPAASSTALMVIDSRSRSAMEWMKTAGADIVETPPEIPALDGRAFNTGREAGDSVALTDKVLS